MQGFQGELRKWLPYIKKATRCEALTIQPLQAGDFNLVLRWTSGRKYSRLFDKTYVIGPHHGIPSPMLRARRGACRFADEIIMEALRT